MNLRAFCLLSVFIPVCCVTQNHKTIRYIALGDSYTICEGGTQEESWPLILAKEMSDKEATVELIANPSVTGYTTQDLIEQELQVCLKSKSDFVTLLIGVNDWVQGVPLEIFHKRFNYIIDTVQAMLPNKKNLILITIPDFGVTPTGALYGRGRNITEGIKQFNEVITEEAAKRNLEVVNIFPETQKMTTQNGLIAKDGLHPSAKEYALWEKLIKPVAEKVLKMKN